MDMKQKLKGLPAGCTRGHLWTSFKCSVWHVSTHVQQTVEITNTINMVDVHTELSAWTQTGMEFLAAALS